MAYEAGGSSPVAPGSTSFKFATLSKCFRFRVKSRTPWVSAMPAMMLSAMPILCPARSSSRRTTAACSAAARSSGRTVRAATAGGLRRCAFPPQPR